MTLPEARLERDNLMLAITGVEHGQDRLAGMLGDRDREVAQLRLTTRRLERPAVRQDHGPRPAQAGPGRLALRLRRRFLRNGRPADEGLGQGQGQGQNYPPPIGFASVRSSGRASIVEPPPAALRAVENSSVTLRADSGHRRIARIVDLHAIPILGPAENGFVPASLGIGFVPASGDWVRSGVWGLGSFRRLGIGDFPLNTTTDLM